MKRNNIYIILIFIFLFTLFSCKKKDVYYKFTDDELGWIYFTNKTSDSMTYTLKYLENGKDTVIANVTTKKTINYYDVFAHETTFSPPTSEFHEEGDVIIIFNGSKFLKAAHILVEKNKRGLEIKRMCFSIYQVGSCIYWYSDELGYEFYPTEIKIDTAYVNSKLYQNVYKYPDNGVFFCKSYGFIKIEKSNGDKIELIPEH